MDKKYVVRLSREQRVLLEAPVKRAKAAGYKILRPHLLLKTDAEGPASSDVEVAEAFGCHSRAVANVRQRFVEAGLEAALGRKKREFPQRQRKLDGPGGCSTNRVKLRTTAQRPGPVDLTTVGRSVGRPRNCRRYFGTNGPPGIENSILKPHLRECLVIPPGRRQRLRRRWRMRYTVRAAV